MNNFAFAACPQIRNVALCGLVTFVLSACGASEGSSSSGTAASTSSPATSLVSPNVGLIDRSPVEQSTVATNTATTPGSTNAATTPGSTNTSIATPVSGTPDSGSGTTTVASNPPSSPAPSSGTATLDWTPPTQNSDGSTLTDLAGYTVYYGTSPGSLTQKVKITNPGLSAYTMSNLASGTWYFAVASYSNSGTESSLSGVISTQI